LKTKNSQSESRSFNVLFVTPWYPTRDHVYYGVFVRELAKAAGRHNNVVVLHLGGADHTIPHWWLTKQEGDETLTDGLPTYRALYRRSAIRGCSWPRFWAGVIRAAALLWKQHGPFDLVHAHVFSAGPVALWIGRHYRIPVVLSEHNSAFGRGTLSRASLRQANKVFRKADAVLPVSRSLQRAIEGHGMKARFHVVPNTVNTDLFCFESLLPKAAHKTVQVLAVASLVPIKGLEFLLRAMHQTAWCGRSWHLNVVGSGPDAARYQLLAEELGLTAQVTFRGSLTKPEVAALMRQTDVFVLPSLFETFSVATAEALASGVPVLVTDCGGPEEFVDERCGLVVKSGDASSLSRGLMTMLDRLDKYDRQQIACTAKNRFGYDAVAAELDKVYSQVTN
jgi:glycosyltransferase involved in cell wall biosynthesis